MTDSRARRAVTQLGNRNMTPKLLRSPVSPAESHRTGYGTWPACHQHGVHRLPTPSMTDSAITFCHGRSCVAMGFKRQNVISRTLGEYALLQSTEVTTTIHQALVHSHPYCTQQPTTGARKKKKNNNNNNDNHTHRFSKAHWGHVVRPTNTMGPWPV